MLRDREQLNGGDDGTSIDGRANKQHAATRIPGMYQCIPKKTADEGRNKPYINRGRTAPPSKSPQKQEEDKNINNRTVWGWQLARERWPVY